MKLNLRQVSQLPGSSIRVANRASMSLARNPDDRTWPGSLRRGRTPAAASLSRVRVELDKRSAASMRRTIRASSFAAVSVLECSGFSRIRASRDVRSVGDKVGSARKTDFNSLVVE